VRSPPAAVPAGRPGWPDGVQLPTHGKLVAAAGSSLWRTRDLAAAGIAHHLEGRG
jgi:hypothetical protein